MDTKISIHAPRGGSDFWLRAWSTISSEFQSTLPVGGATPPAVRLLAAPDYFNPRSPWGERLASARRFSAGGSISIHAPRGGSDRTSWKSSCWDLIFQSTLPVGGATRDARLVQSLRSRFQSTLPPRGATATCMMADRETGISIHAPRGGSDGRRILRNPRGQGDFNPRSPWGERPALAVHFRPGRGFQSTLPVGGATKAPDTV